jgi:hypothetical protein
MPTRIATTTNDGLDTISFGSGMAYDQLWFTRSRNDMVISVIGHDQTVTVHDCWARAPATPPQIFARGTANLASPLVRQSTEEVD